MNIILLTHSYPEQYNKWRGIFIQEQAKALSLKHNVTVVFFRVDYSCFSPFARYRAIKKKIGNRIEYEVITGRSFPVINQVKYLTDTLSFIRKEILAYQKIDLVHSHLTYPAGFLAAVILRSENLPFVITEHSRIHNYYRSFVHRLCVKYALRKASVIISVSEMLRKEILGLVSREIAVVPNAIDVKQYKITSRDHSGTGPAIGFLGSLKNDNKGLDILLRSVALLSGWDLQLHIGGDGALLNSYISLSEQLGIREKCTFYGEIAPEDRLRFFSRLDIFVLPSRSETFGMVLVEAMSCGIPVIATKCGGPTDIVDRVSGLLTEKNDPAGLAGAIRTIAGNTGTYNPVTIREYAVNNFSHEILAEKLSEIYKTIPERK